MQDSTIKIIFNILLMDSKMKINFDEQINRIGTNSGKFDEIQSIYGIAPETGLAMWTADMDFRPPKCVIDCLKKQIDHGIFGYYGDPNSYNEAVKGWYKKKHSWAIQSKWISVTHGLVAAIGIIIRAYSQVDDSVIIFTPVYHSFSKMIKANKRKIVESKLKNANNNYELDLASLERNLTGREKILLFCSPHNPGGKVWSKTELCEVADFCRKHDLILVSDEIHNDLVYPKSEHIMFPVANPNISDRLVVLVSTTKTFNLAGGLMGNVIIENEKLRLKFKKAHTATGTTPNAFGMHVAESAYRGGEDWLKQLIEYLDKNRKFFDEEINTIPGVKSMPLSATYLAWVDFSGLGLPESEIIKRIHFDAQIAANIGSSFGSDGTLFMRFNLACPKIVVEDCLNRLKSVF